MPTKRLSRAFALTGVAAIIAAALLAGALPSSAARPAKPNPSPTILGWYDTTAQAVAAAGFQEPVTQSRAWAVAWTAAARAVGSVKSPDFQAAALASALHDTLVALVPAQKAQLDEALAFTLAGVTDDTARMQGIAAGQREAAAVLASRAGDGLDTASVDPTWVPPSAGPGVWQPTRPSFGPAVRAGEGKARPFLLASDSQFRPGPPPALDSQTYLDALNEVRTLGGATSAARTAPQTDDAKFWAQNSIDAYVQVLRAVLSTTTKSFRAQVRLVAAFHAITTDAQIAVYDAKYAYDFWRPVTAIRTGTVSPDPGWTPLIATPRHPEYPSGHSGYAGAAQQVLTSLVGKKPLREISVTSSTDPGSTHVYRSWSAITQENIDGRVWEGIHFRFSDIAGAAVGERVAGYDLARLATLLG